jgi:hypothetical protein
MVLTLCIPIFNVKKSFYSASITFPTTSNSWLSLRSQSLVIHFLNPTEWFWFSSTWLNEVVEGCKMNICRNKSNSMGVYAWLITTWVHIHVITSISCMAWNSLAYHIYTCDLQRALFTDMLQSTGSLTVRSALSALTTIVSLVVPDSSQGACFTTFLPPVAENIITFLYYFSWDFSSPLELTNCFY